MDFFRDPFWGFGQFLLAVIDFVRSLRHLSPPEAIDQQKPIKEPIRGTTLAVIIRKVRTYDAW